MAGRRAILPSPQRYDAEVPIDLHDVVCSPQAERNVREYFAEDTSFPYTGRRFEALQGGGDRPATANVITADDLVAVEMLNVQVPAETAIALLDGDLGPRLADLLAGIDTSLELGTDGAAAEVAEGSPAYQAWSLLKGRHGIDFVIAGKLLARKRPKLIPVYDNVVRCQFGGPKNVWLRLHNRLAKDDEMLRHELCDLKKRAAAPEHVQLLRLLDVVLWMRHWRQHGPACPGFATVSLD